MSLFTHVLDGMVENNKMNDVNFDTWDSAEHAIETYKDSFDGDYDDDDHRVTVYILDALISRCIDGGCGGSEESARNSWSLYLEHGDGFIWY